MFYLHEGSYMSRYQTAFKWFRQTIRWPQGGEECSCLLILHIFRCSQEAEGDWLGGLRSLSLLFADDVLLLASLSDDLKEALERFVADCEAAGMKINTSNYKAMLLSKKMVEWVGNESLS